MKKRGQLLGQPFVMIFALIVGALILAWGSYEVYKLLKVAKDVEVADCIKTLEKDAQRYYYFESGTSNTFKLCFPPEFSYACFVDHDAPFACNLGTSPPCVKPPGYNTFFVAARKNDNVFVFSKSDVLAYNVPYIKPPALQNPLCINSQKPVLLTSKGTYVEVSDV